MNPTQILLTLGDSPAQRLVNMMARLRDKQNGCEWDIAQNFKTIAPYTIEEAYEVADAIERNDMGELKSELGDLLLQVVFHARMGEEEGLFDFASIADALVLKMIKRHPHVFGDKKYNNLNEQLKDWENIKAEERQTQEKTAILDDVALALPSLMRAQKLQNRAARVGFDWDRPKQVLEKINEEANEIIAAQEAGESKERVEEEIGDLLFAITNLARKLDIDAETSLRRANDKFVMRFGLMEKMAEKPMNEYSLAELEELWIKAKKIKNA